MEFACHSRTCAPPPTGQGGSDHGAGGRLAAGRSLGADADKAVGVISRVGGRSLVVGGWVRDQVLGLDSKDVDIEVHGASPGVVGAALSRAGKVDAVGLAFGVLKFGADVDVSFPRRESKTGEGHKGFDIAFDPTMTVAEALGRRDFTINSLAFDPRSGEVIDPFGGRKDLANKVLRATNPETFADDPLRVLRAVQFASRFDFTIDPGTAKLAKGLKDEFKTLPVERVWTEWNKILTKGQSVAAAAAALKTTGWDEHFPGVTVAGGRHADRALKAVGKVSAERRSAIAIAAMFAGRPDELKAFVKRIGTPNDLSRDSASLSKTTDQLLGHHPSGVDAEARLVARALGTTPLRDWLAVHPNHHVASSARRHRILDRPRPVLLTGDHLIKLGWRPGPKFGTVLREAQVAQDTHGWTSTQQALDWLESQTS